MASIAGDRVADVAAHALVGRAGDEDAAAAALGGADQVRAGEQPQRLAQRRAADAELGGQALLGADAVAGPQPLGVDLPAQLAGHDLARRRRGRLGLRRHRRESMRSTGLVGPRGAATPCAPDR